MTDLTKDDETFLDNPSIKITYGINNKKEYFESDRVFVWLIKKNQEAEKAVVKAKSEAYDKGFKDGIEAGRLD